MPHGRDRQAPEAALATARDAGRELECRPPQRRVQRRGGPAHAPELRGVRARPLLHPLARELARAGTGHGGDDVRAHGHVLTPGRYVGATEAEDDGEPFEQKMKRLSAKLEEQFAESAKLEKAIKANLKALNYGG